MFQPRFWHSGRYGYSGPVSKNEGIKVLKTKEKKIRREIHGLNEEACVDDDSFASNSELYRPKPVFQPKFHHILSCTGLNQCSSQNFFMQAEKLVPDCNKELNFFTAPIHLILSMEVKSCLTLDLQREDLHDMARR